MLLDSLSLLLNTARIAVEVEMWRAVGGVFLDEVVVDGVVRVVSEIGFGVGATFASGVDSVVV